MSKFSLITLVGLGIGVFIGCGGGGGGTVVVHTPEYKKAIDDYIMYAPVCEDTDDDGKIKNEKGSSYCTKTDYLGRFILGNSYPLVLECTKDDGCTDFATNDRFIGKMSAPAGSTVLTPLTTLVQEYVRTVKETNQSAKVDVKEIETKLKKTLGIPENIDIKKFDPIAEVEKEQNTNTTGNNSTNNSNSITSNSLEVAKKVLAVQTQVQVILTATAKLTAKKADETEIIENISKVAAKTTKILISTLENNTNNENNNTNTDNNTTNEDNTTIQTGNLLAKKEVLKAIVQTVITDNSENNENNNSNNSPEEINATVIASNLTKVLEVVTKDSTKIDRKKSAAVVKVVEELVESKNITKKNANISEEMIESEITQKENTIKETLQKNKEKAKEEEKKKEKIGGTSLTGAGSL